MKYQGYKGSLWFTVGFCYISKDSIVDRQEKQLSNVMLAD